MSGPVAHTTLDGDIAVPWFTFHRPSPEALAVADSIRANYQTFLQRASGPERAPPRSFGMTIRPARRTSTSPPHSRRLSRSWLSLARCLLTTQAPKWTRIAGRTVRGYRASRDRQLTTIAVVRVFLNTPTDGTPIAVPRKRGQGCLQTEMRTQSRDADRLNRRRQSLQLQDPG